MTDVLRETLEERGRATPWEDVDALVAAGDRRVRRRRVTGAVAAAAVVAVLAVVAPLALGGLGQDRTQVASAAFDPSAPSWAVDGVVHVGDLEVDLGEQPEAYVLTEVGVVWISAPGDVLLTDPTGDDEVIGRSSEPAARALVTDGRYVAWLDREAAEIVEYDLESGEVAGGDTFANLPGNGRVRRPELIALDGGDLWWYDRQVNQINTLKEPDAHSQTSVGDSDGGGEPLDVEGGHLARSMPGRSIEIYGLGSDERPTQVPGQGSAVLSPSGAFVVTQPRRDVAVYDVRTSSRLFRLPSRPIGGLHWLDDNTLEVLVSGPDAVDVAICRLPMAQCSIHAEDVAPSLNRVVTADGTVDDE